MVEALLVGLVWLSGYLIGHAVGAVRVRAEFVQRDMQKVVDQWAAECEEFGCHGD